MARVASGDNLDGRGAGHAHVIVRGDAGLALGIVGRYCETAGSGEDDLAFGKQHGLEVFFTGCGVGGRTAVGKRRSAAEHNETAFFALVVDGRSVWICEAETTQNQRLLVVGVNLQGTGAAVSGEFVLNLLRGLGVVHGDIGPANGHDAVGVTAYRCAGAAPHD